MAATFDKLTTPADAGDYRIDTGHRKIGLGSGLVGLMIAMAVVIIGLVAANELTQGDEETVGELVAIGFGLNTLALATLKVGIAIVLIGILVRLWLRVESIKSSLPALKADAEDRTIKAGDIETPYGDATVGTSAPEPLSIHRMARTMWAPMLVMGYMAVVAGLIVSFVWAGNVGTSTGVGASAWTQGLQFLGEGMVLAGISFLLGSILGGLREGGGQVQAALGVPVITLEMPNTAKAFLALMMTGLMVSVVQFILYLITTGFDELRDVQTWFAFLGPLRELGLGLMLAGITLALATIANVLGFQFWRIRDIVKTGK
jgi:hypothetical protein